MARINRSSFHILLSVVGLVLFTAIVIVIIFYIGSYKASMGLVHKLQSRIFENTKHNLSIFLEQPQAINQLNAATIAQNPGLLNDFKSLGDSFLRQLQSFNNIQTIAFGLEKEGQFIGLGRTQDDSFTFALMDRTTNKEYKLFNVDQQNQRADLVYTKPDYDARSRVWYQTAVRAGDTTWTPPYIWAAGKSIGVSTVLPVTDGEGDLLGVLQSSMSLDFISHFLEKMSAKKDIQTFLMDSSGLLLANSVGEEVIHMGEHELERLNAATCADPFIRTASLFLTSQVSNDSELKSHLNTSLSVGDQLFFLSADRISNTPGMSWILVTGIPKSTVMSQIDSILHITLGVTLIAIMVAAFFGLTLARRLTTANQHLKNSEQQFKKLSELAPVQISIVSLDKKPKYLFVNRRFMNELGYSSDDIKSLDPINVVHPEVRQIVLENAKKRLNGQTAPERYEMKLLTKAGDTMIGDFSATIIQYDNSKAILTACMNITERKNLEVKLHKLNEQLQQNIAEKDKLFSIIAHDLKSPVSGIIASAEILANHPNLFSEEELLKIGGAIYTDAKNTYELLEDLLQWARMCQGGIEFNPSQCSLENLINMAISSAKILIDKKNIFLKINIEPSLHVFADQPMIKTVIRNIIFNAIKFTYHLGKISITAEQIDNKVIVKIEDNGIGMNEQILSSIFIADKKKTQIGTEGEIGTGLGLMLCKQFIDQHGEDIWIESEPNQGTKVFFSLKIA